MARRRKKLVALRPMMLATKAMSRRMMEICFRCRTIKRPTSPKEIHPNSHTLRYLTTLMECLIVQRGTTRGRPHRMVARAKFSTPLKANPKSKCQRRQQANLQQSELKMVKLKPSLKAMQQLKVTDPCRKDRPDSASKPKT
jgi:hypothetical protein